MSFWAQTSGLWQHRPGRRGGSEGELDSVPSTHLSTQHGVSSSDTLRNRLNLLFPLPPVHYYGPPHRATATLLLSSPLLSPHPLPYSCPLSVAPHSSSLFVFLPMMIIIIIIIIVYQISPSIFYLLYFWAVCLYLSSHWLFPMKLFTWSWKSVGLIERWSCCNRKQSSERLF